MATGPKVADNPLDLITKRHEGHDDRPGVTKIWFPIGGGSIGFLACLFTNLGSRRPPFSGIQKFILATGIGIFLGVYAEEYREGYLAQRDAVLRHYIELHPEDFPPFERKKFSEILNAWYPVR